MHWAFACKCVSNGNEGKGDYKGKGVVSDLPPAREATYAPVPPGCSIHQPAGSALAKEVVARYDEDYTGNSFTFINIFQGYIRCQTFT